jgi:hypothetical protein
MLSCLEIPACHFLAQFQPYDCAIQRASASGQDLALLEYASPSPSPPPLNLVTSNGRTTPSQPEYLQLRREHNPQYQSPSPIRATESTIHWVAPLGVICHTFQGQSVEQKRWHYVTYILENYTALKMKSIQRHRDHERYRASNNWYRLGVLRSRKQHKTMGRRKQHNVSWVGPEFMAAGVE